MFPHGVFFIYKHSNQPLKWFIESILPKIEGKPTIIELIMQ